MPIDRQVRRETASHEETHRARRIQDGPIGAAAIRRRLLK
jgi:hypothetical protein